MKPTWERGNVRLYLGDCREVLPHVGKVDAVVTDPPYGIDLDCCESGNMNRQKFNKIEGDNDTFDPSHLMVFQDVILFGCNHYCHAIPSHDGQWYFWDKTTQNNGCRIAEGEFMWHKRGTKPRAFRHLWSGAYRASESGERSEHPTQKPVALMKWCIEHTEGQTILDPYMGSGSCGVAAVGLHRSFIGIEIDPTYFEIAVRRIDKAIDAGALFAPVPPAVREVGLFDAAGDTK